jgi:hypothetical protein
LRMQRNGAVGGVGARRSQAGLSGPHPFRPSPLKTELREQSIGAASCPGISGAA